MTLPQSPRRAVPASRWPIRRPAAGASELAQKTGVSQVGESSHELRALHGLRFLAAFCILFSHACSWLANFKDTRTVFNYGEFFTVYGMPLFFVLSGFVIHYNYSRLFSTMRLRWAIFEFLGAPFRPSLSAVHLFFSGRPCRRWSVAMAL